MYDETCLENPLQSLTIFPKISIIDSRSLNMAPYLWCYDYNRDSSLPAGKKFAVQTLVVDS